MSTITHAEQLAEQLVAVARTVELIPFLTAANHVEIEQSRTAESPAKIEVHTCQPEQLTEALETFEDADGHSDEDGILRWVSCAIRGIDVTFYRR